MTAPATATEACSVCRQRLDGYKCPDFKSECTDCCGDPDHGDYTCGECGSRRADFYIVTWESGEREEVCERCYRARPNA